MESTVLGLMQRFARVVLAKLRALVNDYTITGRHAGQESILQAGARHALAWALRMASKSITSHPYLDPEVAAYATANLDRMARDLFVAMPKGGPSYGTG